MSETNTNNPEATENVVSPVNPNPTVVLPASTVRTYASQKALYLLAKAGVAVVDRHRTEHVTIEAAAAQFVPVAESFVDAYDKSRVKGPHRQREADELERAIAPVHKKTQAWVGTLIIALDKFDASAFANRSRTPRGTIDDAIRLVELVRDVKASGRPLDFADTLEAEMLPLIEQAEKELADVAARAPPEAQKRQQVRDLALALQRDLVGLRRTIKATLGATHPDYRRLILRSGNKTSDDDVEVLEELESDQAEDGEGGGDGELGG